MADWFMSEPDFFGDMGVMHDFQEPSHSGEVCGKEITIIWVDGHWLSSGDMVTTVTVSTKRDCR